jgi:hypothetical protein
MSKILKNNSGCCPTHSIPAHKVSQKSITFCDLCKKVNFWCSKKVFSRDIYFSFLHRSHKLYFFLQNFCELTYDVQTHTGELYPVFSQQFKMDLPFIFLIDTSTLMSQNAVPSWIHRFFFGGWKNHSSIRAKTYYNVATELSAYWPSKAVGPLQADQGGNLWNKCMHEYILSTHQLPHPQLLATMPPLDPADLRFRCTANGDSILSLGLIQLSCCIIKPAARPYFKMTLIPLGLEL